MVIQKIVLENFRIYYGKNEIALHTSEEKNIFVISGKNGFGKTTFLMSLVWCLYGRQMPDVDELYAKEIESQGGYPKYIANSLNRQAKIEGTEAFSVEITIADAIIPELTCKEIRIKREYSTRSGENLTILIDSFQNQLISDLGTDRFKGEEIFIRDFLLPIEIAKFFFFDAEKIVTLAEINTAEQRKKLSFAYSEILGIKKYEDLKREYEETRLRLAAESASPKDQMAYNSLKADVENARLIINNNESFIYDLKEKRAGIKFDVDEIQRKLIRLGDSITIEELEAIKREEVELNLSMRELQRELEESYDIVPFAIAGGKFLEIVQQVELELQIKQNQYRFEDVEEKADQIINDLLNEQKNFKGVLSLEVQNFYFSTIKKLVKQHLFPDTIDKPIDFKVLHEFSDSQHQSLTTLLQNLRFSFREKFKRLTQGYNMVKNDLAQVRRRVADAEAIADDAVVRADRDKKNELEKSIAEIDGKIRTLDIEIGVKHNEIAQKERQLSELGKKFAISDRNKSKNALSTQLSSGLSDYLAKFKQRKKKSLEDQILKGLQVLMHKKGFIHAVEVEISRDVIDIHLLNKRGERIRKEALSKGEQQMYATALLRGLVEESEIEFPVFIDSPMQKFDDEHALNIIQFFYPSISEQVVIFPLMNKELIQSEYSLLADRVAGAYFIVNRSADHSEFVPVGAEELFQKYDEMYH
ncbi:AAA family ATPase [Arundinibacter roseus]|uniref:DNA sulfur modification protein DndD n=1 Tax=Arundinibacter roseus TaxID=2070510 RepID=A0A4R4K2Z8_9BACT|nr:AAA family ATPase [Arundinibacter roseus]TDB60409.1 DNA sulfur modification protein DndD [Arundinibacter roseus]